MSSWMSPELNTVILSGLIAVIGALATWLVAWLRAKTKQLNDMAIQNREILEENTKIAQDIRRQTDGINKKMVAIAEVVAFTKGRIKGRREGESDDPYEELDRLEEHYARISDVDFAEKGKMQE